jgi:hypothetical protein
VSPRECTLDWNNLQIQRHDLSLLDQGVMEEEIHQAVMQIPAEKAPGPDDFIGDFYKACWSIVKTDLVGAIQQLFNLGADAWELLNSANVTLVAKKDGAETVADYRPISLMHSIAKILGKVLATRLATHLNQIVSPSQSAFIQGCSI